MKNYPPASYIEAIEIDGLFGEESVRLHAQGHDPRIVVIYGKNGTGKTTILGIVQSLLSAEDSGGHRTRLAKLPFSRALVKLSGGVQVEAKKKDGVQGAFDWSLKREAASADAIHLNIKPRRNRVLAEDFDSQQQHRYAKIRSELRSLIPQVVFLDDKRTFYDTREVSSRPRAFEKVLPDGSRLRTQYYEEMPDSDRDPVYGGLAEMVNSIRREALMLANRGNLDAQSIYTALVKGVAAHPQSKVEPKEALASRLSDLERRSKAVSAYGLVSSVDHAEMLGVLNAASSERMEMVGAVIGSYVESLSARLAAIESLHKQIDSWINNINNFMEPKKIGFKVGEGLSIKSRSGNDLPVSQLSSGERHLLMLMTKAFLLRSSGGLMVVDEPELSLNSAWQRRLISGVLDAFGGGACQLLVASHSLEICSQYQNSLVEL